MKILITIPDEKYHYIKELERGNTDYATTLMLYHAVKYGKPFTRPQGEWEVLVDKHNVQTCKCSICGRIEVISHYDFDKIPFCHCGADMRKPNCVRCDHFGKCEGCEKGEEE